MFGVVQPHSNLDGVALPDPMEYVFHFLAAFSFCLLNRLPILEAFETKQFLEAVKLFLLALIAFSRRFSCKSDFVQVTSK